LPAAGDDVYADGYTVTINQNVTVASLRTTQRSGGTAGGAFNTSGAVVVNADSRAGTTPALQILSQGVHNGNSYGGTGVASYGTVIRYGAVQNGNATAGTGNFAQGSFVEGILNGNSYGGGATSNAWGAEVLNVQNGNAIGGSGSQAYGSFVNRAGFFNGQATGGSVSGAHGIFVSAGSKAVVTLASGSTSGAFGVSSAAGSIVLIKAESGSFPKSLAAGTDTTTTNVPFLAQSGGCPLVGHGGLVY
jgi:hypothetical protein